MHGYGKHYGQSFIDTQMLELFFSCCGYKAWYSVQ